MSEKMLLLTRTFFATAAALPCKTRPWAHPLKYRLSTSTPKLLMPLIVTQAIFKRSNHVPVTIVAGEEKDRRKLPGRQNREYFRCSIGVGH